MSVNFLAGVFFICGFFSVFFAGPEALAADSDIIINEIGAYESTDHEWIEIYNKGSLAVDMSGWSLNEDGINHGLSVYQGSDMIIEPGEYAIIAERADLFILDYPSFTGTIIDSAWATLALGGELIELRSPAGTVESFTYISIVEFSLERANPYINEYTSVNWQEHASGSTAGMVNSNFTESAVVCGNGALESGEECDDGNLLNGDGCSAICENESGVEGTVAITIDPDSVLAQNISPTEADIVFRINGDVKAWVKYGKTVSLENISLEKNIIANVDSNIKISSLECNTQYYYAVYAENLSQSESDQSETAVFTTLPCGIEIHAIDMLKTAAKANNKFENGWEWKFSLTIWDMSETKLKLKFTEWTGASILATANNMRYSADSGVTWIDIVANDDYPILGADISSIDNSADTGRQVDVIVQMKVPNGTLAGQYDSAYGIKAEK